jgi:hypothetical protein
VTAGEDRTDESATAILGTRFETDVTNAVDWVLDYSLQVGVPEVEETNTHLRTALEIELSSVLDLDVAFVWDRIGDPQPDQNGQRPERDDFYITVGLGVDF